MNNEEAKQLLIKYNAGLCTAAEKAVLEDWYLNYNEQEIELSPERIEEIGKQIYDELPIHDKDRKGVRLWPRVIAVAALLALTVATWNFFSKEQPTHLLTYTQDIPPGSNRATLTLANGRKIDLNGDKSGIAIQESAISYLDGVIINERDKEGMQILTTPKGGQYQVILPDGTKVWLNSASSLTYPVSFAGKKERRVTLSGEAYFEVQKMKGTKLPFIVAIGSASSGANEQEVKVLGTHFNINTYNGSFKTTLVEGSVKVSASNGIGMKLKPGDQSVFSNHKLEIRKIDTDLEIAWKNGKIAFESADIQSVMAMLALWYDIEVKYDGKLTDTRFSGSVSRSKNISAVLKLLESTKDVHFKINGREITVMN